MTIVIYIESLRTFTSGMPHRGVLVNLIKIRSKDNFTLVLRKGIMQEHMKELFDALDKFTNWRLVYENRSRRIVNLLALFHYKNHCEIVEKGDIYLSFDAEYLGTMNHPQIVTLHDLSSVWGSSTSSISFLKRFARKFTIENAVKNSDCIVAISEFTKKDIINYFQIDNINLTVIYNGIDPKWLENNSPIYEPYSENYWIWWGAYSKRKNLERLLKAYDMLLQNHKNHNAIPDLYLVGNTNEYSAKISLMIESADLLTKKVKIYPQQSLDELIALVSHSKGLVFPSLYEGFGLPVIEAYSQGIPVLISDVSSLPEIAGGLGVVVDPLDIQSIEKGLILLNEKSFRSNDLQKWAEKFSYEQAAYNYSKLIDRCIKY